jgi:hypothetical protein
MLGSTAIGSTVFLVSTAPGLLADLIPLKFICRLSAFFATEDLRGMAAHKSTIARLPQAPAAQRIWLRELRSLWLKIRLGSGHAGGLSRKSSLAGEANDFTARRFLEVANLLLL